VQAFLTAHDKQDLDAEEKLVDWDDVTESSRNHFIGEIKSGLDVKITAKIESMPAVPPDFSARYNIPPEKFFVVVYDDPRGAITVKFPIAKKTAGIISLCGKNNGQQPPTKLPVCA
jgi:hypothetical protein